MAVLLGARALAVALLTYGVDGLTAGLLRRHTVDSSVGALADSRNGSEAPAVHIPTLFCFTVARPNTHDVETAKVQLQLGMLTGCDAYAVYSNVSTSELFGASFVAGLNLSSNGRAVNGSMDVGKDPRFHSALNAPVFQQAWQQVFHEGTYRKYDWTVKLDPDTVFRPDRLRLVLSQRKAGLYKELGQTHHWLPTAAALGNGGADCLDMIGAIMVINRDAMVLMETLWPMVLNNNIMREDSMILNFMQWYCKCDEPEPRLLHSAECAASRAVPCRERVAFHGMKTGLEMALVAHELGACNRPFM